MTTFFRGRRCVITGGGSGIGLETARLLAAKGAQPLLWDLDAAALAAAAADLLADALCKLAGAPADVERQRPAAWAG